MATSLHAPGRRRAIPRAAWLAAGAGGGAASVGILVAWSSMFPASGVGPDLHAVVPGLVFGLVVGALVHAARPVPAWRVTTLVVVSTVAHHLAVQLAQGFKSSSNMVAAGVTAGTAGAFLLGSAALVLFPARSGLRRLGAITMSGAALGSLLDPALRMQGGQEWGIMVLYVPWQAGVAFALSFVLAPRAPAMPPGHAAAG